MAPRNAMAASADQSGFHSLPHELLSVCVLPQLGYVDLCKAALVNTRLSALTSCGKLWRPLFEERWGEAKPMHVDAAQLAGSWRTLFRAKHATDAASAGWARPCEYELRAALNALARRATPEEMTPGPSGSAKAAAYQDAPEAATISPKSAPLPPGSPSSLLSAASVLSPAPSAASSVGVQLVYLLDGSGSVSEEDFNEMKRFVLTSAPILAGALGAGALGKVGVVQFSTEPRVEVPLGPLGEGTDALAAGLDAIVRINGGTNIASAIARAGAMMKADDQGTATAASEAAAATAGSSGAPAAVAPAPPSRPARLVLLLTDGRVDTYQAREARATACRMADELSSCTLAAFGVGRGVDRTELLHIIDTPAGDAASRYLDLYTRDDAPW